MKVEHQNVETPAMTVFMRRRRPAKDKAFADQDENRFLICCKRGSQFCRLTFFVHNGTPRYLIGSAPQGIPVDACIAEISGAERPEAKKDDFCRLTARPERFSNSCRI
ncbi:unnamed protein product [Brassica oleracea]